MSPRSWVRLSPKITPLAWGSWIGVRSPEKYGRITSPPAPGGDASASLASRAKACAGSSSRAALSRNQWVSVPLVDSPAIDPCSPLNSHGAYHSRASSIRPFDSMMVKMVDPYITIMSPGLTTPTLSASDAASMVPAMTGVPAARPVARAAFFVT